MAGIDIIALEQRLAPLSHGSEAITILQESLRQLARGERQAFLNQHLLRAPIRYEDVHVGFNPPIDHFNVLQGDIIRTEAAYLLGARQVGDQSYVIGTSTCDIVLGRRETALLLPVQSRRLRDYADAGRARNDLANLIAFKTTRYFYLPPLPDDPGDVLFNVALLDPFAQCANEAPTLAERRASMTLLGWRVFGALLRSIQVREAAEEAAIRRL
jgi:hypothetical protein